MPKKEYDVVIVGAGVSGLMLANLLNNSRLNVLLVEKRNNVKRLINNYYGTFWECVKKWKLNKYIVTKSGWGFYATETKVFRNLPKTPFCVLEMNKWAGSLKLNCDTKTKTEIKGLRREENSIVLTDQNKKEYSAKIVVDCSGDNQTIGALLGIPKSRHDSIDISYELKDVNIRNLKEMFYFQDCELTNAGGWFYPLSRNRCIVGISEWTEGQYLSEKMMNKRLQRYMKQFDPINRYTKGGKIVEAIYKIGPTQNLHKSIAEDNYLALGDAAGAGTPFIGEGFRVALDMAESAYGTINEAFKSKDFSRKVLKKHSKTFKKDYARYYKWSVLLRAVFRKYLTNKEANKIAKRVEDFNDKEYYDVLLSKITPKLLIKLFQFKISLMLLKNALIYHTAHKLGIFKLKQRKLK
jgi:flavin-dependent dehydrogenase